MQTNQKPPTRKRGRSKNNLPKLTSWTLTALGAASLISSIVFSSQILAFIGLGLLFWGLILTYVRTEEYVKESLLTATALSALTTLNQTMEKLDYKNKAIYLPPKYLRNPEESKAYIPKQKEERLPPPEPTQEQAANPTGRDQQGTFLTPPGAELARLLEETLGTSFTRTDMQTLQQAMPKLIIEELEMATNFEIEIKDKHVHVKIEDPVHKNLIAETKKLNLVHESMGSPLSSAIACAIAKASGKAVIIENEQISQDAKSIIIEYRTLEEEKPPP